MILDTMKKEIERIFQITAFSTAFHFSWTPSFVFNGEDHEMWEIVFVMNGKVEVSENENIYLLEKNDMIIHAPWEFHRIRSAEKTSPTVYVLSFYACGELPKKLKEGVFSLSVEEGIRHSELCERVASFLKGKNPSAYAGQEAADALSSFLIQLSKETVQLATDISHAAAEYRKLAILMKNSVCDNKKLSDFAHECGISVSYVKHLFKEYVGITPKAYYDQLRVRYASELIEKNIPISEIAENMSFSSSNYFSTFYKKHTGLMPTEYKAEKKK